MALLTVRAAEAGRGPEDARGRSSADCPKREWGDGATVEERRPPAAAAGVSRLAAKRVDSGSCASSAPAGT